MATNAQTQVPGGKPPFPPFQSETFASQIIWLALAFALLYVLMSKVALPRISGIMQDRRERVAADLAQANALQQQSEAALAAYEASLAEARARAQTIAAETRDKLMAESETSRKAIEASLNDKLTQAEATIAATKSSAMQNVRTIAQDLAGTIVERLVGTNPPAEVVSQAVAQMVKSPS